MDIASDIFSRFYSICAFLCISVFLLHLCRELQTAPFWGHVPSHSYKDKTQTFFLSFSFSISEMQFYWALLSTKFAVQRFCKRNFCHFVATSRKGLSQPYSGGGKFPWVWAMAWTKPHLFRAPIKC